MGWGACIGTSPEGTITVAEGEAGAYDEVTVMERVVPRGEAVIAAYLEYLIGHGERELYSQAI